MSEIDLGPVIAVLAAALLGEPEVCRNCPNPEIHARDLCAECYFRWEHAGFPGDGVPDYQRRPYRGSPRYRRLVASAQSGGPGPADRPPGARVNPAMSARLARLEDYAWMLSTGESREIIALRLGGVSERTLERYDDQLRELNAALDESAAA